MDDPTICNLGEQPATVDVAASYPGCPLFTEVGEIDDGKWADHRAMGHTVETALEYCQYAFTLCLKEAEASGIPRAIKMAKQLLDELKTDDARRYVAAKLGAM